ncbi:MAG: hypothetical protein JSS02_20700 [Planctomycetes bacterium]|nr:hypothetical protein [Planctomycetota bacterium]
MSSLVFQGGRPGNVWIVLAAVWLWALVAGPAVVAEEAVDPSLLTVAERSDYQATSRSAEVQELLQRLEQLAPHIALLDFAKTTEGRPLTAAIVANPPVKSPEQLVGDERLVALIIGNIHSGECDGKEALLRLLRELALQPEHPLLKRLVLLVVPNYNADGNDKVGLNNRPGQIGPAAGAGTRENAQGLNLNRDFVKLECPETRGLVRLMNAWKPHLFMDAHTTNGSYHRYPLTYACAHNPGVPTVIRDFLRGSMLPEVSQQLARQNWDTFYYGNFAENHTRWVSFGHEPRYSTEYGTLRGMLSILVESYSYIPYRDRIEVSHAFISECLKYVADHATETVQCLREGAVVLSGTGTTAEARADVPIRAALAAFPGKFTVKGYEGPGDKNPKDYSVDFFGRFEPTQKVARPLAYAIPANLTAVVDNLREHGVVVEKLSRSVTCEVTVATVHSATFQNPAFEKHPLATVETRHKTETRTLAAGDLIVRTAQPLGVLAIYLLEPESDDGYVKWNFLDEFLQPGTEYPIRKISAGVELPTGE